MLRPYYPILLILGFLGALLPRLSYSADSVLLLLTEEWRPYNYRQGDRIIGIGTELVEATLKRAKVPYKLKMLTWKGAYEQTLRRPNTLLYTTSRTEKREKLFHWIGPLFPKRHYLYKLSSRQDIRIKKFDDLKKYRLGVIQGGSTQEYLESKGLVEGINFFTVRKSQQNLDKLFRGRVDLIPGADVEFILQMRETDHDFGQIQKAFLLIEQGGFYIAANLETPEPLIQKLQKALDQLLAEGVREKIIVKYSQ
ncbi:substrate-binding periplasmic protein [Dongshaea marina]|uniref:substrate-binding periplasmic protein n=1 Tax=Dongshaea marina TaxID=2047966 RepID=UPI000D3EBED2|nr:ABC transporter substrate-binding protein [Dongshaea marina]